MVRLVQKEVYSDYTIELNECDLRLVIEGLNQLVIIEAENPEKPCMSYTYNLLQELKEIKNKQDEEI